MAEPRLSIRSARARELTHTLARLESRTIKEIVERALEFYAGREPAREVADREPAEEFFERMRALAGEDIDLDEIIREHRVPHKAIDL